MHFFTSAILFFSLPLLHECSPSAYIRCSSRCPQVDITFVDPLTIPDYCQETNNLTDIYEQALVCIVDYRIDYDAQRVYINFKATNDSKDLQEPNQSQYLIQTIWLGFNRESNQPNITDRSYRCAGDDDCARTFYLNTIEQLIDDGKVQLNKIHRKLYNHSLSIDAFSSRRCIDSKIKTNRSAIRCPHGLCYADSTQHEPRDTHDSKIQECKKDHTPTFFSEMTSHLTPLETIERELIQYKCNKHLCNRNEVIHAVRRILHDYSGWKPTTEKNEVTINVKSSAPALHAALLFVVISRLVCF
jgi:hypothetical protein